MEDKSWAVYRLQKNDRLNYKNCQWLSDDGKYRYRNISPKKLSKDEADKIVKSKNKQDDTYVYFAYHINSH